MADKPRPEALAFIICDTVIDDRATNKKSLIGLFNNIYANNFPCRHSVINVFLSLTKGHGDYECSLLCVKDDESQKIVQLSGPLKFNNPLSVVEVKFEIRGMVLPEPGIYRFDFLCGDVPVVSRKFKVIPLERKPHEPNN
jgi:hypothetical protein